jgi:hypothetical protein
MTCAEVEKALPELLDGAPDGVRGTNHAALQIAFDAHVKSCPDCSDLVSELKLIVREAHQMAASEEPAPRVWVRIAAQLREEGLIREPADTGPVLVPTPSRPAWSAWWLAPVAAALLVAGSYIANHKQPTPVAQQPTVSPTPVNAPVPVVAETPATPPTTAPATTAPATTAPAAAPAGQEVARHEAPPEQAARLKEQVKEQPDPAAEDQQFLSVVSTRAPSMRATYENQLQAVNADIRETQNYVDRNPGDADARQHLMDAYQQKALLYQIGLDRIQ